MEFNEIVEKIMLGKKPLSYSALRSFLQSPKHFKKYKTNPEVTKAMMEGVRFHMACLKPDKFKECYWVLDDAEKIKEIGGAKPRSTKAYKEWVEEEAGSQEGEMVGADEYQMYLNMSEALRTNSATKELMAGLVDTEYSFLMEWDGFALKGAIDGLGEGYLVDLKKVADASFEKVKWDIKKKNYHMQGAIYCKSMGISKYYLVYIDADCNITVVNLEEETLQAGFNRFEYALQRFHECAETDSWDASYEFYNNGFVRF